MTSPEQLFNSLKLHIFTPDDVLTLPEQSLGDLWVHELEASPERPAAYFDERLQFYLVVKAPSKPAGGQGPTPPLYLLNFLIYLQVAIEAIYVPSYTPASSGVAPRPPAKLRLPQPPNASSLNIPTQSSPLRNSVQNLGRPAPLQPPDTPNPSPMMSDGDRILGRTDMGVAVQSYFWGEENDGQRKVGTQDGKPSFQLLWLQNEDTWAMVYRLEVTVEYLRVRMQDPVLCLTASTTLRDKPMAATPQRKGLIELFKEAGGVYDIVKSKSNGNVPPKGEDITAEEDIVYGLEEVNLFEGLTEGITFTPENPGDKLSLSTSRMGAGVRRQAFSLASAPSRSEPLTPASVGTTTATPLSTRPLPTLRKAFRKTLPTDSGIQVRLLPSFVPHAFTDKDLVDHDEDTSEEHSVVLSIELENSASHNSGFLVERVQVSVNGEDSQTRLLGNTNFPLALRSHDQYNLLYAVMFMLPPDLLDHTPGGRPSNRRDSYTIPRDNFMHRVVTIIVTGRPFDLEKQDVSSGGTLDLGMRTEPFESRWHCPLDLVAMAQQNVMKSIRAPSTVPSSVNVGPNRDVYPVPPSPFPSVMSQKRHSGVSQSASSPFTGPLSGSSITPDGSSFSSIFTGAPELPSATVAGSKRHTIAGLASLAAKRNSFPQIINQRASTPMMAPPSLSLNSPRFVPTPPSVAVANLSPSATSSSIHSQATPKGSPTLSGHGLLPSIGSVGHTPVTPAFPAYPDASLPSSPLSQAPMHGLMAAIGPPLDGPPSRRESLSEHPNSTQRTVPYANPVLQPVLVSVSLLSPENESDDRIYPMDTFTLEVFVFNESDVVRRCEISCPARKRWRQEAAERMADDSSSGQAGILPLENHIRIGPLRPGTCQSVRMRFLAVQTGAYTVDTLTLTDTDTGFATNLKDVLNVVVHRREELATQGTPEL